MSTRVQRRRAARTRPDYINAINTGNSARTQRRRRANQRRELEEERRGLQVIPPQNGVVPFNLRGVQFSIEQSTAEEKRIMKAGHHLVLTHLVPDMNDLGEKLKYKTLSEPRGEEQTIIKLAAEYLKHNADAENYPFQVFIIFIIIN